MIYSIFKSLDLVMDFTPADAHCDIPCKIYDPQVAQIATLSVIRFIDLIQELEKKDKLTLAEQATLSRLVQEKESHATKVKEEIRVIWGDYFKQPQFTQFPDTNALVHNIMLTASSCKQHISRDHGEKLLKLVNEFSANFWATKGISTFSADCPYPPSMPVIYPKLG
ncbi:superoxide dismutase, Ni [Neptunomonas japonica]|uniref:superoxide dismutase, Ni n=1 Tax=Neptunomonas japonica TaxID=417574 RepID=UPI00040D3DB4|nr:superoxide dismutase, Ni [Neptunomonas japonica]